MNTYRLLLAVMLILCFPQSLCAQNRRQLLNSFDSLFVSDKTLAEADTVFQLIAKAPIATKTKKEKANNCENRAEFAFYVLEKQGFRPINFWIFKEGLVESKYNTSKLVSKSNGLVFNTKIGSKPLVYWGYHVATGIILENNGLRDTLVFDPWTQGKLVDLPTWSLSFFNQPGGRTIYIFPVTGLYKFYGTTSIGQLSTNKSNWEKNLDTDFLQMYCGLCGITPNSQCQKSKYKSTISQKRLEIKNYLDKYGIVL